MKTIFVLIFMLSLLESCGKKEPKKCLSRHQKMMECMSAYNETHNPYYVERVCGEKYPKEGCYK